MTGLEIGLPMKHVLWLLPEPTTVCMVKPSANMCAVKKSWSATTRKASATQKQPLQAQKDNCINFAHTQIIPTVFGTTEHSAETNETSNNDKNNIASKMAQKTNQKQIQIFANKLI